MTHFEKLLFCSAGNLLKLLWDCQQITLVMLNGFCPLSKTPPLPAILNRQNQDGWNIYQLKSVEKYTPFSHWIWSFEDTFYNNSCCFMLDFTSADIIFHYFLELHTTLSEKKIFVMNFPFLTDSLKLPHPLNGQNLLSVTKVCCWCSHMMLTKLQCSGFTKFITRSMFG